MSHTTLNPLSADPRDAADVCNCLYALLQRHQDLAALKDRQQAEQRSLRFDLQSSDKAQARLKAQLEAKQQEVGELHIKARCPAVAAAPLGAALRRRWAAGAAAERHARLGGLTGPRASS
jgi:septal ring factor EnvC (AmiA/AmiB activator)